MIVEPQVSDQLRTAIEACGLSRYRIAQATGIHESQLSRFIHGNAGLALSTIDRLCSFLGVTLAWNPDATEVRMHPEAVGEFDGTAITNIESS